MFVTRWCGDCSAEMDFASFDCAEHGADCPELACAVCGLGIEVPSWLVDAMPVRIEVTPAA